MKRFSMLLLILPLLLVTFACSGGGSPVDSNLSGNLNNPGDGHEVWGAFDVVASPVDGSAKIIWNRELEVHVNVLSYVTPPKCYDCIQIVASEYQPINMRWFLQIAFKNPTNLTGRDVRAVLTNPGGNKKLLNPDGITDVWGTPMPYRAINVDPERTFGPYEVHGRVFDFYYPAGEGWLTVSYLIDAHVPDYVKEPLIENGTCPTIINNGLNTGNVTVHVFDHQGDLLTNQVTLDLTPIGGSPIVPMYDDGAHADGAAGDGTYGATGITTKAAGGYHMVNIFAVDLYGHLGWGQVMIPVQAGANPGNHDPIIDSVTTDRTTAKSPEKIRITVNAHDPDGDLIGYQFEAQSGSFSGQINNQIDWKPSTTNTGPQDITVIVVDDQGGSATTHITCWSTDLSMVMGNTQGKMPTGVLDSFKPDVNLNLPADVVGEVCYFNFWATWCPPCVGELPELTELYNHFADSQDYNHIMSSSEDLLTVQQFLSSYNYGATYWCIDAGSSYYTKTMPFGNTGYIPWHLLFDRDNNCRWVQIGSLSNINTLIGYIEQLL